MRGARGRVVDVDRGAAFGVGVGVGAVGHDFGGEGDDGVGVAGCVAAGAETWVELVGEGDKGEGIGES